jgi:hypothetical protein
MTVDFNAAQQRLETLESLLITVVAKAGGMIKVDEVPPGKYTLEAEEMPGGVMLILTDSKAPRGQGGKRDGNDTDERASVGTNAGDDPRVQAAAPSGT